MEMLTYSRSKFRKLKILNPFDLIRSYMHRLIPNTFSYISEAKYLSDRGQVL